MPNRNEKARHRPAIEPFSVKHRQKIHYVRAPNPRSIQFSLSDKFRKLSHVAPVRLNRVIREPLFDSQVTDERPNIRFECQRITLWLPRRATFSSWTFTPCAPLASTKEKTPPTPHTAKATPLQNKSLSTSK